MTFIATLVSSQFAWYMNIVTQDGKYFTRIIYYFNESEHNNKYYSNLGFKHTHVW